MWENSGFREIYDYKGVLQDRRKLKRKQEQIFNQFDAQKQLFQKVYYNPALLQDDEIALRKTFIKLNDRHELSNTVLGWSFFLGYWPLAYYVSRRISPKALLLASVGFYGAYSYGALPFT